MLFRDLITQAQYDTLLARVQAPPRAPALLTPQAPATRVGGLPTDIPTPRVLRQMPVSSLQVATQYESEVRLVMPTDVPPATDTPLHLPQIYPLIGESHTGKSTTVHSLTGSTMWRGDKWRIATRSHGIIIVALFSGSMSELGFTLADVLTFLKMVKAAHLLLPLRVRSMASMPNTSWLHFLYDLHTRGWHVQRPVALGETSLPCWETITGMPKPYCIPDATLPANFKAAVCREIWGWF